MPCTECFHYLYICNPRASNNMIKRKILKYCMDQTNAYLLNLTNGEIHLLIDI